MVNKVASGKELTNLFKFEGIEKDFMAHTGFKKEDILFASWESFPKKPAYCIVKDDKRKEIIVAVRGSLNAFDMMTDLIVDY